MMPVMGRTPVAAAIVGAMIGIAVPACDLVFAPGKGPGANADAPSGDGPPGDDGPNGGDGSTTADAPFDAQPTHDAEVDATCMHTCYTVDLALGDPVLPGTTGCESAPDDQCTLFPELVGVDMCSCTAGQPEIYVENFGTVARIALIADPPAASYSLDANFGGMCIGANVSCTHDGPCFAGLPLYVWDNVPISAGQTNYFLFYDDDGSGCTNQKYTLTINL